MVPSMQSNSTHNQWAFLTQSHKFNSDQFSYRLDKIIDSLPSLTNRICHWLPTCPQWFLFLAQKFNPVDQSKQKPSWQIETLHLQPHKLSSTAICMQVEFSAMLLVSDATRLAADTDGLKACYVRGLSFNGRYGSLKYIWTLYLRLSSWEVIGGHRSTLFSHILILTGNRIIWLP